MADLNFQNENSASNAVNLDEKISAVQGAIDDALSQNDDAAPAAEDNKTDGIETEMMLSKAAGVSKVSQFITGGATVGNEMKYGQSDYFLGDPRGGKAAAKSSSIFIGQSSRDISMKTNGLGMAASYAEKKQMAKAMRKMTGRAGAGKKTGKHADLVTRSKISGMSLTGDSAAGGGAKVTGMKGVKIDPHQAVQLGLVPQNLVETLDGLLRAKHGPMSDMQLQDGLRRGNSRAVDVAIARMN